MFLPSKLSPSTPKILLDLVSYLQKKFKGDMRATRIDGVVFEGCILSVRLLYSVGHDTPSRELHYNGVLWIRETGERAG